MKQSFPSVPVAFGRVLRPQQSVLRARARHACRAMPAALLVMLAACAAPGGTMQPLAADRQAVVEGRVVSVDASPMAYDGDALVVLDSVSHGQLTVHLPARTNLCRAQGLGLLGELRAGDRLQVEGLATGPADITVCQEPTHRLQRID